MTQWPDYRFNLQETAGAIGDYGTLFPIIIGAAVVTGMELGPILLFMGIGYIATGIYYKLPMPVEPMKSIGAVAIAGGLTAGEVATAGLMMGVILLVLAYSGGIGWLRIKIPDWLIRGIQLGLALILFRQALGFIMSQPALGILAAAVIVAFNFLPLLDISSLLVLGLGIILGIRQLGGLPVHYLSFSELLLPVFETWSGAIFRGVLPQLPLTIGNAVLATTLMIDDLFERKVAEEKLVKSMGFLNLVFPALGAFPLCHGAGGLAAQYRFGARTGGSNVISGLILIGLALFFASPELIELFPYGVLGAMLIFSALQLFKSGRQTAQPILSTVTAGLAFFTDIGIAFILMVIFILLRGFYQRSFS